MNRLTQRLHRFWFQPALAERLAILRIGAGGFAFWYLWTRYDMMIKLSKTDVSMFEPVGLAELMASPMLPEVFAVVLLITIAFNVAYILGWKFKYTGPIFALLLHSC